MTKLEIKDLLSMRTDLSTFLVHLTRENDGQSAKDRLSNIIKTATLEAGEPMGLAVARLDEGPDRNSQKCVCFSETPLENVKFMTGTIAGRSCSFEPFGIAIPKMLGRKQGANPVWYIDQTSGHNWLTKPLNNLIEAAVKSGEGFGNSDISQICPFLDTMGSGGKAGGAGGYRKEFWWEREWRHVGNFTLGYRFIVLCPEDQIDYFKGVSKEAELSQKLSYLDPQWSLERIIASLAGFSGTDVELL